MAKKLLSKDYYKIVIDALLLPEKDVDKYYYNIVEEWHNDNPDLFTELKEVLNEWIEWYKGQARGGTVPTEMPDGTIKYFDRNQIFSHDEGEDYTKWVKHDLYEHKIFLLPLTSLKNVKVNKAYFENHLRIIESIESIEREKELAKIDKQLYVLDKISNMINEKLNNTILPSRLQTNLTETQRSKLFDLLVKDDFIPDNTDPECFKWVFGDPKQPGQWQPIAWKPTKQGLRDLLTPILGTITEQHIRDIKQLFLKDGKPFKMYKPKKDEVSGRYGDICTIIDKIKNENLPTSPDHL